MIAGTKSLKKAYRIEHMVQETIMEKDRPKRHQRTRKEGSPSFKEWGKTLTGDDKKEFEFWLKRKSRSGIPKRRGKK